MVICCAEDARRVRLRPARAPGSLRQCDGRRRADPRGPRRRSAAARFPSGCSAGRPLSADLVAAEAAGGDPLAVEIVMDTARYLAVGIVSVLHTVDPNGVLLGGTMTFGGAGVGVGPPLSRPRPRGGRRGGPSPCWPSGR